MASKKPMSLGTLNTILNTAPLIIQGATRLVKMIKERNRKDNKENPAPDTLEGLKKEIMHINQRIDAGYGSDLEQIKLIEELARQNELLATSLKKSGDKLTVITAVLGITLVLVLLLFAYIIGIG